MVQREGTHGPHDIYLYIEHVLVNVKFDNLRPSVQLVFTEILNVVPLLADPSVVIVHPTSGRQLRCDFTL